MSRSHIRSCCCWLRLLRGLLLLRVVVAPPVEDVACVTADGRTTIIPAARVNDGYCDCLVTGVDEPGTSACAGSALWPGRAWSRQEEEPSSLFTCPQQPSLHLSHSKVGDGICDCCDGADEAYTAKCVNNCAAVLAEERRQQAAVREAFTQGHATRTTNLELYAQRVTQTLADAVVSQETVAAFAGQLAEQEPALATAKVAWMDAWSRELEQQRQSVLQYNAHRSSPPAAGDNTAVPDIRGLLDALSVAELQSLLVHACQVAGEISAGDSSLHKKKTCVPLRLAGLAAGLWWDPKTYAVTSSLVHQRDLGDDDDRERVVSWADLVHYNVAHPTAPKWHPHQLPAAAKSPSTTNHRRLDEDWDAMYDDEEDYPDYDEYDRLDDDEEDDYQRHGKPNQEDDVEEEGNVTERENQTAWLKDQVFSQSRIDFLTQTDSLLQRLDELTKEEETEDKEEPNEASSEKLPTGFDPVAVPMLRSQIQKRRQAIEQGLTYGVSARVLLQDASLESRDILESLFYGVWEYGKLSAWHVWQIYQSVVPELNSDVRDNQSCPAPGACPPAAATRIVNGQSIMLPPAFLVQVADEQCRSWAANGVCGAEEPGAIPTMLTDGMFGYFVVEARTADAPENLLFAGSLDMDESKEYAAVLKLIETQEYLEKQKSDLERDISEAKDLLGLREDGSSKYGPDGELFGIRDSCLEMKQGKYVYELCLFGSSKQKEGDSRGGTVLGQWTDASIADDGKRVWSWQNGAKCWNGPQRSATAYVSCGATSKIISADEPETCKYVFEVESHLACDETYATTNNLL
jgi:hypothetical protein